MNKSILKTLAFFITLTLGVTICFIWYYSNIRSTKQIENNSLSSVSENQTAKLNNNSTESEISKLSKCDAKNSFDYPKSHWKGKRIISGGVVNQWIVCGNLPKYPKSAKDNRISGTVIVELIYDEIGKVIKAHAKSGNQLFYNSSIESAYETRFAPRLLGGSVYKVRGTLIYKFDIHKGTHLLDPSSPQNPFRKTY
jgi:outer membrane biosynthesis protein TonB